MTSTLPVPVRFALPNDDWVPARPEELTVADAAFLAVRNQPPGVYAPTISVSGGWRDDESSLEQIGNESLALLVAQGAEDVQLVERETVGGGTAPAAIQSVSATVAVEGRTFDLRQAQVIQALVDASDSTKRVVVMYTFTSTREQFDDIGPEFEKFMASVEIVSPAGSSAVDDAH